MEKARTRVTMIRMGLGGPRDRREGQVGIGGGLGPAGDNGLQEKHDLPNESCTQMGRNARGCGS